jgi:hypothetical protein
MSSYRVMVDDNFHYMDKDERAEAGTFVTAEEAIAACRGIVDDSLTHLLAPGMSANELLAQYRLFGDDPFVVPEGDAEPVKFSAWDYAEARAADFIQHSDPGSLK